MSDEEFTQWTTGQSSGKQLTRYKSFAIFFCDIYGSKVASILHEPPFKQPNFFNLDILRKHSDKIHWLCDALDDLVDHVEK